MPKVYQVTYGGYDDIRTVGIFDSREAAKEFIATDVLTGNEVVEPEIIEYELRSYRYVPRPEEFKDYSGDVWKRDVGAETYSCYDANTGDRLNIRFVHQAYEYIVNRYGIIND